MVDDLTVTHNGVEYSYSTFNNSKVWVSTLDSSVVSSDMQVTLEKIATTSGVSSDVFDTAEVSSEQKSVPSKSTNKIKIFE